MTGFVDAGKFKANPIGGEWQMKKLLGRLWKEEKGQGMAEYGLILALVAVVVIGALTLLGGNIKNVLNEVGNKVTTSSS